MTDLSSNTVEELSEAARWGSPAASMRAFDELARRLEELNKLCKYYEKFVEELQQRSAAHDAEIAVKVLEQLVDNHHFELASGYDITPLIKNVADKYRAKAGRKE